jgi:hypothetical protein
MDKLPSREEQDAQVDKSLTERGFHPIAKSILFDLHDAEGAWQTPATEALVQQTVVTIENVQKSEGIKGVILAVSTLISMSTAMFAEEASKQMGIVIHAACDRVIKAHNLIAELEKRPFQTANPATAAKAVAGIHDNIGARAPKLGEKLPEGAVKASSLGNVKRRI